MKLAGCLVLALLWAPGAAAQEAEQPPTEQPPTGQPPSDSSKAECATAYAETQRERQAGRPVEALKHAVFCAQASCPELLVGDCTRWVSELEASLPTIVLEARDPSGNPLSGALVTIDGAPRTLLDGRAVPINPGEHSFRFEHGERTLERRFVVVEGGKNQRLVVTFPNENTSPGQAVPGAPRQDQRTNPLIYAPLGLAVLGAAGFTYFGLKGNARYDELEGECAPNCSDDDLDPVRRDWLIADISLGVSVVSAGVFTWLLLSDDAEPPPAELDLAPGGAAVRYRTRF